MHIRPRECPDMEATLVRDGYICVCGASLNQHEYDDKEPFGGCPETGCSRFRVSLTLSPTDVELIERGGGNG